MKKLTLILLAITAFGCHQTDSSKMTKVQEKTIASVRLMPGELSKSLYQITDPFLTQNGDTIQLRDLKGKLVAVSMIFTSCAGACPRLVADLQRIEKKLGKKQKEVTFLLISFDTEYDTPAILRKYAQKHDLDQNWLLLHGSKSAVRTLSILLQVSYTKNRYRFFSHENKISILDQNGVLRFQEEGLEKDPAIAVQAIRRILNS